MSIQPLSIHDCASMAFSTGQKAQFLTEFRDKLSLIHPESIYFHYWGSRLEPLFEDQKYHNDFALWADYCLNEKSLAERLEIVNPSNYGSIEDLRRELLEIVDQTLDEKEIVPSTKPEDSFYFRRAKTLIFDTHKQIESLSQLANSISLMSDTSIYYHFIDARYHTYEAKLEGELIQWLKNFEKDHQELFNQLNSIDPYYIPLKELKPLILKIMATYGKNP